MDTQVRKLKKLVDQHLHKSQNQILLIFGRSKKNSDSEIWFFRQFRFSFFNDEIAFIFEEDKVVDICLTQYFLWQEVRNIYYMEGQDPEYKVVSML